jgi:hypothetical protein
MIHLVFIPYPYAVHLFCKSTIKFIKFTLKIQKKKLKLKKQDHDTLSFINLFQEPIEVKSVAAKHH